MPPNPAGGKHSDYALQHDSRFGPMFGLGEDLQIKPANQASYSNLGFSYKCPVGQFKSPACYNYLAGNDRFNLADYEVFVIK